jgi:hypothetical protein
MPQKKKPKTERIIVLIISALVGFIIIIDVLTTDIVDNNNIINVTGHYNTINRLLPSRGSLNYDLFIQENQRIYKIGADDAGCFSYDSFISEVSRNQIIKISIRKKNSLFKNSHLLWVVGIEANGNKYLDPECINENLKNNKVKMPLFGFAFMAFGFLFYKFKGKSV